MVRFQTRFSRSASREVLLVAISGGAAFFFINHENLYLKHFFILSDVRIESYFLATVMVYLFLRLVILAAEMRPARAHAELVRCPECGQWLDDPTSAGLEAHRRIELTPKPSPKEVVSAVALRKAVDAARVGTMQPPADPSEAITPANQETETFTSHDFVAGLNGPDFVERMRHSPKRPADPPLKR